MDEGVAKELEATVAARRELGVEHEEPLIAGFLDRIDKEIDRRVEERLAKRSGHGLSLRPKEIGSAVPVVVVAGIFGGVIGVVAALAALVLVFLVLSPPRR
ncbi:MAG: hypothetical protein ACJ75Q_14320 [Gaiellaceae bacterium]